MNRLSEYMPSQESKISSSTESRMVSSRRRIPVPNNQDIDRNFDDDQSSLKGKPMYKRASERPAAAVARRNARERRRVHTVNQAFNRLKNFIPILKQKTKRVSKLKILKAAIDYVYDLQDILAECDDDNVEQEKCGADKSIGKHKEKSKNNQQCITGSSHLDYVYSGAQTQMINYTTSAHCGEDRISRHHTVPYQYPVAIAAITNTPRELTVSNRNLITIPTVPATLTTGMVSFYNSDLINCAYCGQPTSSYALNGPCDRCSAFAHLSYSNP